MPDLQISPSTRRTSPTALRSTARWLVTFVGFPLGVLTAALPLVINRSARSAS